MSRCPKCENDTFELKVTDGQSFCLVQCKKCESAIGVLESINIKERFKTVISNQQGIDRLINERTDDIKKEIQKQNENINFILEVAEKLNRKL